MTGRSRKNEEASKNQAQGSWNWLGPLPSKYEFDVPRFNQTAFQEASVIIVLAACSACVDFVYFTVLRKAEDEIVPIGFPIGIVLGSLLMKFALEARMLKEFCRSNGLTYMSSSCGRRITLKLGLLTFVALANWGTSPYFDLHARRKEVENFDFKTLASFAYSIVGFSQGLALAHVGMMAFLRTYIECAIYSYMLYYYKEKKEILEEDEEELEEKFPREFNNNSYIDSRSHGYRMRNGAS